MANAYDVGDLVRISATFANVSGVNADPTTVKAKFKNPAGTVTTYTYGTDVQLVKDATGKYHVDISITSNGEWWYRWEGTGAVQAAEENDFVVRKSQFP